MEKEEILWIVGIVLMVIGLITMLDGFYYLWLASLAASAEAMAASYGVSTSFGAAYYTGMGVVYIIVGIILMVVGFFLFYKYKMKK